MIYGNLNQYGRRGGKNIFDFVTLGELLIDLFVDEGLTMVKAIKERIIGIEVAPLVEVEWGNHYVRSMASWSLFLALSGFKLYV